MNTNPIGVFDSGMGGISTLRALREGLPEENFLYLGDSANAPYGMKSREEILDLTMLNVEKLVSEGCKAIVIACNTATAASIEELRFKYAKMPIIGLEPALKPAVLYKPSSRIVVMATPLTLKERKFALLKSRYETQAEIISLPCPQIVPYVERLELDSPELESYISERFEPYLAEPIDSIVLGCTHFPFVQKTIRKVVGPGPEFFDSGQGVTRETYHQLRTHNLVNDRKMPGQVIILNTKGEASVHICESLLALEKIGE